MREQVNVLEQARQQAYAEVVGDVVRQRTVEIAKPALKQELAAAQTRLAEIAQRMPETVVGQEREQQEATRLRQAGVEARQRLFAEANQHERRSLALSRERVALGKEQTNLEQRVADLAAQLAELEA